MNATKLRGQSTSLSCDSALTRRRNQSNKQIMSCGKDLWSIIIRGALQQIHSSQILLILRESHLLNLSTDVMTLNVKRIKFIMSQLIFTGI